MGVVGFPEVSSEIQTGPCQPGGYGKRDGLRENSIGTNRSETCCMSFQECLTGTALPPALLTCLGSGPAACRGPRQQLPAVVEQRLTRAQSVPLGAELHHVLL